MTAATVVIRAPPPGDADSLHEGAKAFVVHAEELADIARELGFRSLEIILDGDWDEPGFPPCTERSWPISLDEHEIYDSRP